MKTDAEKAFFLEHGYLHVQGVLDREQVDFYRTEFDRVWEQEAPKVNQHKLLKYQSFIDLIEHPPILERQQAIFRNQTQLLQYDLLRQDADSDMPARSWHRDFIFPGDRPHSINTIVYLDPMTHARGPTLRGSGHPHAARNTRPWTASTPPCPAKWKCWPNRGMPCSSTGPSGIRAAPTARRGYDAASFSTSDGGG